MIPMLRLVFFFFLTTFSLRVSDIDYTGVNDTLNEHFVYLKEKGVLKYQTTSSLSNFKIHHSIGVPHIIRMVVTLDLSTSVSPSLQHNSKTKTTLGVQESFVVHDPSNYDIDPRSRYGDLISNV